MKHARALFAAAMAPVVVGIIATLCIAIIYKTQHTPWTKRLTFEATAAGTVIREGSLWIPRGGPTIVGFVSERPASLFVGGKAIAGQGLRTERLLLDEGPVSIRLLGHEQVRLVWSPPGRRGDPEYVAASSLSPSPPTTAAFGEPGTDRFAAVCAWAILLTWVAVVAFFLRHRIRATSKVTWTATLLVFLLAVATGTMDQGGAGQTWDEDTNWAAGKNYVSNVLTMDFGRAAWRWNFEHPPITKYILGAAAHWQDGFACARSMAALCVAMACALLVLIGQRLFSLRVGAAAGAIAALTPALMAHARVAGHESVSLLWWALCMYLVTVIGDRSGAPDEAAATGHAASSADSVPSPPAAHFSLPFPMLLQRTAGVGAVLGLAVATRFINALLVIPVVAGLYVVLSPHVASWRQRFAVLATTGASATLVFYAVWPRLWPNLVVGLAEAWARLAKSHGLEPFLGAFTNTPPPSYFLIYLVAALPLGWLLLAAIGGGRVILRHRRNRWLLIAWIAAPFVVSFSPVRQDGLRYVLPALLPLALCAGVALSALPRRTWLVGTGAAIVYLFVTALRIHPYYLDYFGEHVGGPRRVAEYNWFETAWWGEGLDRAVAYVNAHAAPGDIVYRSDDCTAPTHLTWFRSDLWQHLTTAQTYAQWFISYQPTNGRCRLPSDAHEVFRVAAAGAPLAIVFYRPTADAPDAPQVPAPAAPPVPTVTAVPTNSAPTKI